jgi:hypothetical protein
MGGCWGWVGRSGIKKTPTGERVPETGAVRDLNICRDGRCTYVMLDSNCASNPDVFAARSRLVRELRKRGADVHVLDLPVRDGVNSPPVYIGVMDDHDLSIHIQTGKFSNGTRVDDRSQETCVKLAQRVRVNWAKFRGSESVRKPCDWLNPLKPNGAFGCGGPIRTE